MLDAVSHPQLAGSSATTGHPVCGEMSFRKAGSVLRKRKREYNGGKQRANGLLFLIRGIENVYKLMRKN